MAAVSHGSEVSEPTRGDMPFEGGHALWRHQEGSSSASGARLLMSALEHLHYFGKRQSSMRRLLSDVVSAGTPNLPSPKIIVVPKPKRLFNLRTERVLIKRHSFEHKENLNLRVLNYYSKFSIVQGDAVVPEDKNICKVCGLGTVSPGNLLLFCDGSCGRGFHQQCYKVDRVPEDSWFCREADCRKNGDITGDNGSRVIRSSNRRARVYSFALTSGDRERVDFWKLVDSYFNESLLELSMSFLTETCLDNDLSFVPKLGKRIVFSRPQFKKGPVASSFKPQHQRPTSSRVHSSMSDNAVVLTALPVTILSQASHVSPPEITHRAIVVPCPEGSSPLQNQGSINVAHQVVVKSEFSASSVSEYDAHMAGSHLPEDPSHDDLSSSIDTASVLTPAVTAQVSTATILGRLPLAAFNGSTEAPGSVVVASAVDVDSAPTTPQDAEASAASSIVPENQHEDSLDKSESKDEWLQDDSPTRIGPFFLRVESEFVSKVCGMKRSREYSSVKLQSQDLDSGLLPQPVSQGKGCLYRMVDNAYAVTKHLVTASSVKKLLRGDEFTYTFPPQPYSPYLGRFLHPEDDGLVLQDFDNAITCLDQGAHESLPVAEEDSDEICSEMWALRNELELQMRLNNQRKRKLESLLERSETSFLDADNKNVQKWHMLEEFCRLNRNLNPMKAAARNFDVLKSAFVLSTSLNFPQSYMNEFESIVPFVMEAIGAAEKKLDYRVSSDSHFLNPLELFKMNEGLDSVFFHQSALVKTYSKQVLQYRKSLRSAEKKLTSDSKELRGAKVVLNALFGSLERRLFGHAGEAARSHIGFSSKSLAHRQFDLTAGTSISDQVHCLCKKLEDVSKRYIFCSTCSKWYHDDCLGLSQAESSLIYVLVCPFCKSSNPEKQNVYSFLHHEESKVHRTQLQDEFYNLRLRPRHVIIKWFGMKCRSARPFGYKVMPLEDFDWDDFLDSSSDALDEPTPKRLKLSEDEETRTASS